MRPHGRGSGAGNAVRGRGGRPVHGTRGPDEEPDDVAGNRRQESRRAVPEGAASRASGAVTVYPRRTESADSKPEPSSCNNIVMAIPENLRPLWDVLYSDVVLLHARWMMYRQLFANGVQTIDVLNESASFFFFVVQQTFLADVHLVLSKLNDPPTTSGRQNLTL
jgi:hypothetical protein